MLMSRIISIVVVFLTVTNVTDAARRVDAQLRARETMRMRRHFTAFYGPLGRRAEEEAALDIKELLQLSEGEEMRMTRESTNVQGTRVERLQEEYKGIPVFSTVVTVRTNSLGELTGDASGQLVQDIGKDVPDTTPLINNEELLAIALEQEGDAGRMKGIGNIQFKQMIFTDNNDLAHLASEVSYLIDGVKRPKYIIDSRSGEVLLHWQDLNTFNCGERSYKAYGGNTKMGKIKYGDVPYCLNMTEINGVCHLENQYVRIVDMKFGRDDYVTETATFPCKNGYDDEVNDAYSPAVDAFFYGTIVGKMFEDWFHSTPLHDKVVIRVHYGSSYENAFWNGVNCTFGDGGSMFFPLTSLDVVGHEIGHGITEQGSGLMYFDESGGINEAFSDIMGEAAEKFLNENDMLVGNDIAKSGNGMRDFEIPSTDGSSIDKVSQMTSSLDPHYSSGIFRRVFYVVVKQKRIPVRQAAQVFLHANRMYWHQSSTFFDASCGTLKAALDLGVSPVAYERAFADVGLRNCNISSHIFTLANNITQTGVTVSSAVKPIFRFESPAWTKDVWFKATSNSGTINIKVQERDWNEDDRGEPRQPYSEGDGTVYKADAGESVFYLRLESTDDTVHDDVSVVAGYNCLDYYSGEGSHFYEWYCNRS